LNLNISTSRQNIKILLVTFEPFMWEICMPIFKSLAPLVWEENEVTYERMVVVPISAQSLYKNSKLPPLFSQEIHTIKFIKFPMLRIEFLQNNNSFSSRKQCLKNIKMNLEIAVANVREITILSSVLKYDSIFSWHFYCNRESWKMRGKSRDALIIIFVILSCIFKVR